MKKTYLQPFTEMVFIKSTMIICGSGDVTSNGVDNPIGYGGVDEEGTKDPASRRRNDVWEEEEDDY